MGIIYNIFDAVGRILMAGLFLQSGIGKIGSYVATGHYMAAKGVPSMLLPLVIILEVVGSIAIILGWKTRLFAFGLAAFCIIAALLFHRNFSDLMQSIMFMKNIAIAGGFLIIFAHGAGDLSLDRKKGKPRRK
ncbi:MAG: Inner membrane protein YqjF [Syntrophorhabdus sp. PtaU1.Bin153]|nr:MAG: Inner membrane protein YqjF [Syntrophorhabdus sp. PtaU1.Bin153]